jgi:integrase
MASVSRHKDGWRAQVYVGGIRDSKVCRTRQEANAWGASREKELAGSGDAAFADLAERWLAIKVPTLANVNDQRTVEQSVRDHVLPVIGHMKLTDIKRPALVKLVRGVAEKGKVETSRRIGQRICAIFDLAVDEGIIESHPAAGLSRVLPTPRVCHFNAVTPEELPGLMRAIDGYPEPVTRIGLLLMAHTFLRTSELIGLRWREVKGDVIQIPGNRMKADPDHLVPITPAVQALLTELEPMTGTSDFLLASPFNDASPISNNTLLFALYRLGYKGRMTGHGFRTVASTVLSESGLWLRDSIEKQLAHKETDQVRDAYMRAQFLSERRKMMEWFSNYLAANTLSTVA